ncbi:Hypothetical protein SSO1714 [Saccharolobus solfataricus P2]|uniref:Uncharacterized protein n=1 Tax=Saccharolobus solfataricus (strain ATCC 35092 / DSM 1617 / JCM 11322 / P2) TaxID=273057 RepID=Q97XL3_SACS2|nr:Hypothetical protein SSO1714 [Saccharolobus solfataricus P2]
MLFSSFLLICFSLVILGFTRSLVLREFPVGDATYGLVSKILQTYSFLIYPFSFLCRSRYPSIGNHISILFCGSVFLKAKEIRKPLAPLETCIPICSKFLYALITSPPYTLSNTFSLFLPLCTSSRLYPCLLTCINALAPLPYLLMSSLSSTPDYSNYL